MKADPTDSPTGSHPTTPWRLLFLLWLLLIAALTTSPWTDLQIHAHWEKVCWIPFKDFSLHHKLSLLNLIANYLLFVPFGYLWVRGAASGNAGQSLRAAFGPSARSCLAAILLAGLVSLTAELYQVYSLSRVPTATDVCANVLGAAVGAVVAAAHLRARHLSLRNLPSSMPNRQENFELCAPSLDREG